jgi:hypothetical protein
MSEPQQIINVGQVANDGTGESLRDAFNAVNNNFANVWAAGPVDSQVIITNNKVSTNETNLDLVLAGNGIGNVTVASTTVPSIDAVYDLGRANRRWDEVHAVYYYGNGAYLTGITGNGGGGPNVYFSQGAPDDASIGDIWIESDTGVQYLYFNDDTSNQWAEMEAYQSFSSSSTYGNANVVANLAALGSNPVSTTGNITAGYFLGNGSQLTGLAATYGNANVVANLAALGSNPVSTTGNVTGGNLLTGAQVVASGVIQTGTGFSTGGYLSVDGDTDLHKTTVTGNLSATGNITANVGSFFIGNGSQLTGIVSSYGNANVVANLAALGSNPVSTTGNITGGNLITAGIANVATLAVTGSATVQGSISVSSFLSVTGNVTGGNVKTVGLISATGNVTGNYFIGNGSQLSSVATQVTGSWTLAAGTNTVSLTVPGPGTYSIWVNGNIPNGIVTYTATVVVTNTNVPVVGTSYGWYYLAGNALVLTAIPDQIVGSLNAISTAVVATTTANVFTFGITNNSGSSQVVSYGYTKL